MRMKVAGQAGPRAPPEVDPDVEALGIEGLDQNLPEVSQELEHLKHGPVVQVPKTGEMFIGGHQAVPAGVGEPIQHRKAVSPAMQNEILRVVGFLAGPAKEAAVVFPGQ